MRFTIGILLAAMVVGAAPAIAGGGQKGDTELGIYGGYGWPDDYGMFLPKNGPLYGARAGYFFTPNWSAEVSAQRLSTKTKFAMLGTPDVDMHLDAVRLNLLYNFRSCESVRPFLTAGVGYEKTDVTDFGQACGFGWNAGGGIRWFPSEHWNLRADGRYVRANVGGVVDKAQGNVEATIGISWMFGRGTCEPAAVVVVAAPENRPPTVSVASDRPEILPGENVMVRATASDPDGDPLTYAWTTTAGRVTGTDLTTTLDFTGTPAPASAIVTVSVSDGHGHTTSSNTTVALREPARPAEAISCLAGGFPQNLSRLNNVDKACLDDMAQRLKADPRAHVVVIGHGDSHERNAEAIGQQRAKAVQDYVVQERGIEASRITIRSAAATSPRDAGTDVAAQARNRRVVVWFVPEGAKEPE
jgi:outer membrane protein OmpA-like peptidoglycan-associated protein/opacity protein-like surface antigen